MFLKKVYKEWRFLFWLIIFFIIGQAFFMFKGIQNVPFFLYYMYGQKHYTKDSTTVILLKTKDGYYNHKKLTAREQEMLINSVGYYVSLKNSGDGNIENINNRLSNKVTTNTLNYFYSSICNDSVGVEKFPLWWAKYFGKVSGKKNEEVQVVKSSISNKPPYQKSFTDSIIFTIKL